MVTVSVIKADIGGYVGHSASHPDILDLGREELDEGQAARPAHRLPRQPLRRRHVPDHDPRAGREQRREVHKLAWDTFIDRHGGRQEAEAVRRRPGPARRRLLRQHPRRGPRLGRDGDRGAALSEPIIVFMADKTSAGAFNLPLYKMFADPFNTPGLVIGEPLHEGFAFEIQDVQEHAQITLNAPDEIYDMLVFIGAPARYAVKRVYNRMSGEIARRLQHRQALAHRRPLRRQGRPDDDRALPGQLPGRRRGARAVHHRRGSSKAGCAARHHGPLMPVGLKDAHPSRFDGPPRIVALGFQLANGKLIGPRDMFDDPGFDHVRDEANHDRRLPAQARPLRAAPPAAGGDGVHDDAGRRRQARSRAGSRPTPRPPRREGVAAALQLEAPVKRAGAAAVRAYAPMPRAPRRHRQPRQRASRNASLHHAAH